VAVIHHFPGLGRASLSFQLIGDPLDTSPLRELCETFEAAEPIFFRQRTENSVTRHLLRPNVPKRDSTSDGHGEPEMLEISAKLSVSSVGRGEGSGSTC
jgi:hypothetical protein